MAVERGLLLKRSTAWEIPTSELLESMQEWIKETQPTCLLHPHGFYVLLLKRTASEEWRLHLWPNGEREARGMPARIHTHDRHVESRILKGSLVNIDYEAREVAEGGNPLYLASYLGDKYAKATTNVLRKSASRIQVEEKRRFELHAGDHYRIERHALHEALVPIDQITVTLICMHSPQAGPVMVVGTDGHPDQLVFERIESEAHMFLEQL